MAGYVPWLLSGMWREQDQGGSAYRLAVYKATLCPCGSNPETKIASISCAACGGVGLLYPVPPYEILAIVSDISQHADLVYAGLLTYGDLLISTEPGQKPLNNYDIAILPLAYGVPSQDQVIQRGSGDADQAWYRIQTVEGAWTVDPATGVTTSYLPGPPDPVTGEVPPDADFTWSGRTITWLSSNRPAPGQLWSIRYSGRFEWIVFDPPSPRVGFGQDLGQRIVLRKRHLVLPNLAGVGES